MYNVIQFGTLGEELCTRVNLDRVHVFYGKWQMWTTHKGFKHPFQSSILKLQCESMCICCIFTVDLGGLSKVHVEKLTSL